LRRLIKQHIDLGIKAAKRGRGANDIEHHHSSARSGPFRPDG